MMTSLAKEEEMEQLSALSKALEEYSTPCACVLCQGIQAVYEQAGALFEAAEDYGELRP